MDHKKFLVAACMLGVLGACGDDDTTANDASTEQDANTDGDASTPSVSELFAVGTLKFGETNANFIKFFDDIDLGGEDLTVDDTWITNDGQADLAVRDGFIYISGGETPDIKKFAITEEGSYDPKNPVDEINFKAYGVISTAFWHNTFVSPTKAYMGNDVGGMVIWNPTTMKITGEIAFPEFETRGALIPLVAFTDRANIVQNGKVYMPIYWADKEYAQKAQDSLILVIDTELDEVVDQIPVNCPAMDYGTVDDDGIMYFSNWTGGPGTYFVLDTPQNCIAKVDPETKEVTEIPFADIADGHEGAAFSYVGNGRFTMSIFDEVEADITSATATNYQTVVGGLVWRVWSYTPETGESSIIEEIGWNSGAVVNNVVDGVTYPLVPGEGYTTTKAYRIEADGSATNVFNVDGWSFRLLDVR